MAHSVRETVALGGARRFGGGALAALLAAFALPAPRALALDPGRAVTQYLHDSWDSRSGLPDDLVSSVTQTRDGYVWLGTDAGPVRFDGVRFVRFPTGAAAGSEAGSVSCFLEDRAGTLWAGTSDGLVRMGPDGPRRYGTRDGLAGGRVEALAETADGTIWIATVKGLYRLAGGRVGRFEAPGGPGEAWVSQLAAASDGSLWAVAPGNGVYRIGESVRRYGPESGLTGSHLCDVLQERSGAILALTYDGLFRLEGERFRLVWGAGGLRLFSMVEDRDGHLWFGGFHGLVRLRDGKAEAFTLAEGLTSNAVSQVFEDREGNVWAATDGGVDRLKDSAAVVLTTKQGLPNDFAWSVLEDSRGGLWVGTLGGGATRLDGAGSRTFTAKDGLGGDRVRSLHEDAEGNVWIGSAGGLSRLGRDGRIRTFTRKDGLPSDTVQPVLQDRSGVLWVGTDRGLARMEGGRFTVFARGDGLPSDEVLSLLEARDGRLWAGTSRGLARRRADGRFEAIGPGGDSVLGLHEDRDGKIWFATSRNGLGLLRIDGTVATLGAKDGLSDTVTAVLEDDAGNFWLGGLGITRVARKALEARAAGGKEPLAATVFGKAEGMRSVACTAAGNPAAVRGRDGRLWFPTSAGVVRIDPARLGRNAVVPPVHVEEVVADGKVRPAVQGLTLPPGIRRLELRYTAPSFVEPSKVLFRWRLEGWDEGWVDAGAERSAFFTGLPPGSYRFRVKACNDDGLWNEAGASLGVTLRPFFWQTRWFQALAALALLALGAAAQVLRVKRLERRAAELERVVDERTGALRAAEERIARLLANAPAASQSLPDWSRKVAAEIAAAIGAKGIDIWEMEGEEFQAVSGSARRPPSVDAVRSGAGRESFLNDGDATVVPITGLSGELRGALVVSGRRDAWGVSERRLLSGFAHQLGAALDVSRLRRSLAAADERRAATRRELHEQGIATLQVCPACGRCYDHTAAACADDGRALEAPRTLPYRLLGRYRLLKVLGQGGMGTVLAAHDERLGREVAVKLIRPDHFGKPDLKERFAREARAVALVQHPNVIGLHDSGELEDGTAFLVMEKLRGHDAGRAVAAHGRGTPAQVASLVRQASAGLQAAHDAGVVHRDVKPENLFLVDEPGGFRVKVVDFGLARTLEFERGLTQTGIVVGTPAYMSPEQLQGKELDAGTDAWSLAASVFEALTGERLVRGDDFVSVLSTVFDPPRRPSSLVPSLPPEVDAAFAAALSRERSRRPRRIAEWGAALADLLEKVPADPAHPGWLAAAEPAARPPAAPDAAPTVTARSARLPDRA